MREQLTVLRDSLRDTNTKMKKALFSLTGAYDEVEDGE